MAVFWKKKQQEQKAAEPVMATEVIIQTQKPQQSELDAAAKELANSLRTYAEASYMSQQAPPDDDLKAAHNKVHRARKIVTEGRIAYALGRCLPEHMAHWHAWSQRDDFRTWVKFDATNITSSRTTEEIGSSRTEVTTNDFTFRDRPYRLVFRDRGLSSAPGDDTYRGEVNFFSGEICVAKFSVSKDLMDEYAQWEFVDLSGFRVGTWMQDVLDMAAQIEGSQERSMNQFVDDHTRRAADEIDLG
ncbi:hypothetical protein [Agrobacterium rubi]|uniref:Uncharacterized protein n=1 Tax=Agrobacterium rubi TaxID=28099 RepID=A0AAE7R816_9HYPH|nr:hypothetical protein [Agrobacterium rubi]NTE86100.1 hypothetical protein [Agrobacterium rubi]NTF02031.1 hypothetical protein [Agrobacterium rubi]NTF36275.1 hypothetical protein [Agrobacterium rubi]OCJ54566.1 hypothetical protein A6U92_21150 [Agrobacterium rubi]QTG01352.1 hypothetical protein G6M88_13570 [Agrobacterium rubi]